MEKKKEVGEFIDPHYMAGVMRAFAASIRSMLPGVTRGIAASRPLAFASEIGVASRPIIPKSVYYGAWALSGLAVACDAGHKIGDTPPEHKFAMGVYQAAFHIPASLVIPAVIIHKVVGKVQADVKAQPWRYDRLPRRFWPGIPVVVALACIPVVVPVVDHATEMFLDATLTPFLNIPSLMPHGQEAAPPLAIMTDIEMNKKRFQAAHSKTTL